MNLDRAEFGEILRSVAAYWERMSPAILLNTPALVILVPLGLVALLVALVFFCFVGVPCAVAFFLFLGVRDHPAAVVVTFGIILGAGGFVDHFFSNKSECANFKSSKFGSLDTCSFPVVAMWVGMLLIFGSPVVKFGKEARDQKKRARTLKR